MYPQHLIFLFVSQCVYRVQLSRLGGRHNPKDNAGRGIWGGGLPA
jgi:hypothetical protein